MRFNVKNTITLIVSLVAILLFGLLIVNAISVMRDPYVHYADRWVPMSYLDSRTQPLYCAQKYVSWLYHRLTSFLPTMPVFYCFNTQAEMEAWIANGYPTS
jgi:hypothetical protein